MMRFIKNLLDTALVPLTFSLFFFLLPPYLVCKLVSFIKRSSFPENVAGKVVLITGASSGIGQCLAYEYAIRGARLALIARREDLLHQTADKARQLGSSDVIVVCADVSKIDDCKHSVSETVKHFGQLDHLVNNAGIIQTNSFDDYNQEFSDLAPIMDINFWGSVYATKFAVPHLRKSRGRIVVIASTAAYIPTQKMSFYCASKAAMVRFFETLRIELMPYIGITIVTPGFVKTVMIQDESISEIMKATFLPAISTEECAKAIVNSTCRGDMYLTEPSVMKVIYWFKVFFPTLVERLQHFTGPRRLEASKKCE